MGETFLHQCFRLHLIKGRYGVQPTAAFLRKLPQTFLILGCCIDFFFRWSGFACLQLLCVMAVANPVWKQFHCASEALHPRVDQDPVQTGRSKATSPDLTLNGTNMALNWELKLSKITPFKRSPNGPKPRSGAPLRSKGPLSTQYAISQLLLQPQHGNYPRPPM